MTANQSQIRRPCENCGASSWVHATPGSEKRLLSVVNTGKAPPGVDPAAGTPVEVFICEMCTMIRLFAVTEAQMGGQ